MTSNENVWILTSGTLNDGTKQKQFQQQHPQYPVHIKTIIKSPKYLDISMILNQNDEADKERRAMKEEMENSVRHGT